jgi:hypothetical protein
MPYVHNHDEKKTAVIPGTGYPCGLSAAKRFSAYDDRDVIARALQSSLPVVGVRFFVLSEF